MITVQSVIEQMKSALDAEGSDYYNFNRDFKPAINSAIDWTVSVISQYIGIKKFSEETFRELTFTKVWQTSSFSRIQINPADINNRDIWTILAVYPTPTVYLSDSADPFRSLTLNLPAQYYLDIQPFIGQQVSNGPIVTQTWNAVGNTLILPHESTFRPELSHISANYSCERINADVYGSNTRNPFAAGAKKRYSPDFHRYGYFVIQNYESKYGGYSLNPPREIEITYAIPKQLASIMYIHTPQQIVLDTDTIPYPQTMKEMIVMKALNFISIKQNNGTNLRGVTDQELIRLISTID